MSPAACSCFPPLAHFSSACEGQSYQRLGRRLYSRLTMQRQTTPHGLSARITRDSPKERSIDPTLPNLVDQSQYDEIIRV